MNFEYGEAVIVTMQIGATKRESGRHIGKPPIEKPGVFLRISNQGKRAYVRVRTVEGDTERSYPIEAVRRKDE